MTALLPWQGRCVECDFFLKHHSGFFSTESISLFLAQTFQDSFFSFSLKITTTTHQPAPAHFSFLGMSFVSASSLLLTVDTSRVQRRFITKCLSETSLAEKETKHHKSHADGHRSNNTYLYPLLWLTCNRGYLERSVELKDEYSW